MNEAQAVREWVTNAVHLVVDNDSELQPRAQALALSAVEAHTSTGVGFAEYREMLSGRGQESRQDFAAAAAPDIRDMVLDAISEALPNDVDPVRLLLLELIDVGDSAQWTQIADHYLPTESVLPEEPEDEDDLGDFELANI